MRKKRLSSISALLIIGLILVFKVGPGLLNKIFARPSKPQGLSLVTKVIDGDTLILKGGQRIRLIGVDTPETVHPKKQAEFFGKESAAFTRKMVEGKQVRLEFDQQLKDKYGRELAYVYLLDDTFLNAEIIKQGYGFAYTKFPFKYMDDFRKLEKEARDQKLGLWAN